MAFTPSMNSPYVQNLINASLANALKDLDLSYLNNINTNTAVTNNTTQTPTNTNTPSSIDTSYVGNSQGTNISPAPVDNTPVDTSYNANKQPSSVDNSNNVSTPTDANNNASSVWSYEQYLEDAKQRALETAENNRQKSIADARSSYAQNLATYGSQAESLLNNNLSGSGYSDYINAQAYAQQRSDVQAANALATTIKADAEQKYNEAMYTQKQKQEEKATTQNNYFNKLLEYAKTGDYTADEITGLASKYGITDEKDLNTLRAAITNATTKRTESVYENLVSAVSNNSVDLDEIKAAQKNGKITSEQYNSLLTQYQSNSYDQYSSAIASDFAAINTSDIDKAYNRGHISEEQYNDLKVKYNASVSSAITAASLFYSNGASLDKNTARAVVNELKNSGWLDDSNTRRVESLYSSTYESSSGGGGGCYAKGTLIMIEDGSEVPVESLKTGDNVRVFNHYTGKFDASPISYIFYDGDKEYKVLNLKFDNAKNIEVLYGHGFFDKDLNKYVLINDGTVADYVGHKFLSTTGDNAEVVTLTGYDQYSKQTECYSVLTAEHINSIANGILTVTDDGERPAHLLKGFYNIFDLDENHKFNAEKMATDIEKYGLFQYDDLREYVTEEQFKAFNGAYLKVAIGKGLVTFDEIVGYIKKFLQK